MSERLLEVRDLTIGFSSGGGLLLAADRVSFQVSDGRTLGIVGESGCGKSVTLRAILGLVPYPGAVLSGVIQWKGTDLRRAPKREVVGLRGTAMSMVFQDPSSCLNPVFKVGDQMVETLRLRGGYSRRDATRRAKELLDRVGVSSPERRLESYPHELSGGQRQRVMIAIAISAHPQLLLADEPTTALDVTTQLQILNLLTDLKDESGMALVLVSHDLGVIAETCDDVVVMYAGRVVEVGRTADVLGAPSHPYTRGLVAAMPSLDPAAARAVPIPGQPPDLGQLPPGCPFAPRCAVTRPECAGVSMELIHDSPSHGSACPFPGVAA